MGVVGAAAICSLITLDLSGCKAITDQGKPICVAQFGFILR
jgi:hypothetical protein